MSGPAKGRLTLGPVLFNWPAEKKRDFYFRVADEAPVDVVIIGEVVCAKRAPFLAPHIPDIAERLARAGKEVVHATPALVMGEAEMVLVRDLAESSDLVVEANDVACAALLAGRAHVVGPFVNVYNEGTLALLARRGARRVALPAELPGAALATLARSVPEVALEVQVFGRLPLALSARCYHARAHGLHKDGCQYVCAEDADGMAVETLDGAPFLAVNGTQTLSHAYCNLAGALDDLRASGIRYFRLWPHDTDMVAVARIFRDVLDGRREPEDATHRLARLIPGARFADGYVRGREGAAWGPPA